MKPRKVKRQDPLSSEDAELLARLEALPRPRWLAPLLAHKTHTQRMKEFYKELDRQAAELSPEDAELQARLEALPTPAWSAPMLAYRSHTQRMSEWYRELDQHQRPVIWRKRTSDQTHDFAVASEWTDKRRGEVKRIAAARGDVIPEEVRV